MAERNIKTMERTCRDQKDEYEFVSVYMKQNSVGVTMIGVGLHLLEK